LYLVYFKISKIFYGDEEELESMAILSQWGDDVARPMDDTLSRPSILASGPVIRANGKAIQQEVNLIPSMCDLDIPLMKCYSMKILFLSSGMPPNKHTMKAEQVERKRKRGH
jgi:hypothetical protein